MMVSGNDVSVHVKLDLTYNINYSMYIENRLIGTPKLLTPWIHSPITKKEKDMEHETVVVVYCSLY